MGRLISEACGEREKPVLGRGIIIEATPPLTSHQGRVPIPSPPRRAGAAEPCLNVALGL